VIDHISEKIEPIPSKIWYYYGEYQPAFNNYVLVHFEEGLPQLSDGVFDASKRSLIVVDDHMSDINQVVADTFPKISHHRNLSVLHLTQNLFDRNKHARRISLNAHYLDCLRILEMSVSFPFWLDRCIQAVGSLPKKRTETPRRDHSAICSWT